MHQLQQMQDKAKESCMISFRLLHSHLKVLPINDLKRPGSEGGYERACVALFDQDIQTFTGLMLVNLDQLAKQLDKEEFQFFLEYTRTEVRQFHDTLIQHIESVKKSIDERAQHKREYDSKVNERQMQSKEGKVDSKKILDDVLVVTKSSRTESEKHVSSSRSGKDTYAKDADVNSVNDKQPMAEVQLFAEHNILANEQQHSEQSESVYDTHLLEKVDRNTIPKSTVMSHRGGQIDQNADAKKCQIQEKVFANAALKNELRKLKGKNMDTKFAKPSILKKPVLQPLRN
ncbi:hypothetical protein Tco_1463886, partial [Tanacetum coccineum]